MPTKLSTAEKFAAQAEPGTTRKLPPSKRTAHAPLATTEIPELLVLDYSEFDWDAGTAEFEIFGTSFIMLDHEIHGLFDGEGFSLLDGEGTPLTFIEDVSGLPDLNDYLGLLLGAALGRKDCIQEIEDRKASAV